MADPISIFGAAAGAVQIADTALRLSRKAYGFLCEVKDAKKDIVTLRDALRDAESNVRSLRNYIDEFARSRNATVEFEVLPSTITESIQGFRDDLNILAAILPVDLSPNLAKKIKWVFDKKKIKDVTKRLDRRKIDVIQITNSVGM
ncbi:hypothetical protein BU16DRAFT_456886 [Lophium mytilinum]|uniref:Fungal N-terminal domain-containing protein n=1 Tax=Lophium mytilinum TaxID=390894 RepID=A0A6A6QZ03_9PEZI|nr:hypothetical protein BU16DRAFT_456886 [Lophium mytilinum]